MQFLCPTYIIIHDQQNHSSTNNSYANVSLSVSKEVQVGNDQEKAQSEKDSHSKNRGGKKPN